jgi:Domain of unknown function (DUF4349)
MADHQTAELEAVDDALAGRAVAGEHAELAELALLLRDDRPQPDPSWAAQLDRRAAAGFRAQPRRRPWRYQSWAPVAAAAALILPLVVAIAVFEGGGDEAEFDGSAGSEMPVQESTDDGGGSSASGDAAGGAGASGAEGRSAGREYEFLEQDADRMRRSAAEPALAAPPVPTGGDPNSDSRPGRRVERSATLTLAAPARQIDRVASRAGRVASDLGGFVSSSSVASTRGGDIVLRVPSNQLNLAIRRLSELGRVRELSRQSRDITSVVVSARERLTDARTERESLLRQLADAVTVNETESIRARLRIVSREIARARAQWRNTTNRAEFADIQVLLTVHRGGPEEEEEGDAWTPADAFDDALRVLEVAVGVALVAAAALLPLLIAGVLGWAATRGVTRRRRERALDLA